MKRPSSSRNQLPALRLGGVKFRWPGPQGFGLIVDEFEVARGERVLLLGPSGGGKSTLLNLVCGIVTPQEGRIDILEQDIAALGASARDRFRAEHFGIVFQTFNLLPYVSALDNVLLPLRFARERRKRVTSRGSAKDEASRLLAKLGIEAGQAHSLNALQLSIGQQQRVAVARALIGEPEIIIADEPTSALDKDAQRKFLDLLFHQLDTLGATLLTVSHDERIARRFDRVVNLEDISRVMSGASL